MMLGHSRIGEDLINKLNKQLRERIFRNHGGSLSLPQSQAVDIANHFSQPNVESGMSIEGYSRQPANLGNFNSQRHSTDAPGNSNFKNQKQIVFSTQNVTKTPGQHHSSINFNHKFQPSPQELEYNQSLQIPP